MSRRVEGVDVARGVASLIMIQGHAYDGWVAPEHKASAAYLFTRLLGSLPLPAFLVLAGAAIVLRVEAAIRRGEPAVHARRSVTARGFAVLGWGYLTNLAYALLDGADGLETLLRADVLHVIGLSIVALAQLGIRGPGGPAGKVSPRRLELAALALVVVPTLACPWLSPLGGAVEGPARFLVALFVDVPRVSVMPWVPLVSWLALGALLARLMLRWRGADPTPTAALAGAPPARLFGLAAGAALVAWLAAWGTGALVDALGGSLSRAHPAVWLNVVDLGARGAVVLGVAAALTPWIPERPRRALVQLGRGSLVAYVFHIPFCYGRLGEALRGRLDMPTATGAVLALMALSYGAVWLRDRLRARRQVSSLLAIG